MRVVVARHGVADGGWDAELQALHGHFLQCTAWQRVQQALGHGVIAARGDGWMWAGAVRSGRFPRYMYVPGGPVLRHDASAGWETMRRSGESDRLDFVRVEPDGEAPAWPAALVAVRPVQPRCTWVLDLAPPEGELRRGLSAGHRGSVNAAERRGIRITSSHDPADIAVFLDLQARAQRSGGFRSHPDSYHRVLANVLMPAGAATLYVASVEDRPVAAALGFDFGDTRYYAHAASDPHEGRRLGAAAPLVWAMLLDARREGKAQFDFWGVVPDAPPGHPWAGFSRFKMAFGGRLVERNGTWELPLRPLRHRAYTLLAALPGRRA